MTRKITSYYTKVLTIQKGFNSLTCQHQKSLMYTVHAIKQSLAEFSVSINTFQTVQSTPCKTSLLSLNINTKFKTKKDSKTQYKIKY